MPKLMVWHAQLNVSVKEFKPVKMLSFVFSECEKTEETLLTSWYPAVTAVFNQKDITKGLKVITQSSQLS